MHSLPQKPLENACYPTKQIQIFVWLVKLALENKSSDERIGKVDAGLESSFLYRSRPKHLISLCSQSSFFPNGKNPSAFPRRREAAWRREGP